MKYTVIVANNETDFGIKAASAFTQAVRQYDKPDVILPTGNTPLPFYAALREMRAKKIPAFFYRQLDEYLGLWAGHRKLFLEEMKRNLLEPLRIGASLSFNGAADPQGEFMRVVTAMKSLKPAKIGVIGIGGNGHVGFNEPGSSFFDGARIIKLAQKTREDNSKDWEFQDGPFPTHAITLGIRDLRELEQTILLVRGEGKAEILAKALTGPVTQDVPASYLQNQRNMTVIADRTALSKMPGFNPPL